MNPTREFFDFCENDLTEFQNDFRKLLKKHNAKIELWLGNGQPYMAVFVRNSPDEPFDREASFTCPDEVITPETITFEP